MRKTELREALAAANARADVYEDLAVENAERLAEEARSSADAKAEIRNVTAGLAGIQAQLTEAEAAVVAERDRVQRMSDEAAEADALAQETIARLTRERDEARRFADGFQDDAHQAQQAAESAKGDAAYWQEQAAINGRLWAIAVRVGDRMARSIDDASPSLVREWQAAKDGRELRDGRGRWIKQAVAS